MNIKKHIPNTITCGNLLCGCLAVVSAFNGSLVWSAYFVGIAAVLDFFDGFVARLLKVNSETGKQLDSLADMVTFGLVPGVVMYHLVKASLLHEFVSHVNLLELGGSILSGEAPLATETKIFSLLPYVAFLITVFSALRLAKFNIDTRQSDSFIGVPTPANAILICSFPLILDQFVPKEASLTQSFAALFSAPPQPTENVLLVNMLQNPYFLIGLTLLMSFLLVAELPLFALKFKNFGWKDNKVRYLFLIISVTLLILFQVVAIPFIIFLYIILSVINNIIVKQQPTNP